MKHARLRFAIVSTLSCLALAEISAPAAASGVDVADSTPGVVRLAVGGGELEVCTSGPTSETPDASVRRAVIVVHGASGNACDHLSYVMRAATEAGRASSTLVLAPRFVEKRDALDTDRSLLAWPSSWRAGGSASSPALANGPSSFAVLDALVDRLDRQRFPQLRQVVVAGHSAGGQLVHRYAALRAAEPRATPRPVSYLVANPSSYVYFDEQRHDGRAWRPLTTAERLTCPGWNRFKYGLSGAPAALAGATAPVSQRYAAAPVTHLLGGQDDDPGAAELDTTCAAAWQGPDRLTRGLRYQEHLLRTAGTGGRFVVLPGVGHEAAQVYRSAPGRRALLGTSVRRGPGRGLVGLG